MTNYILLAFCRTRNFYNKSKSKLNVICSKQTVSTCHEKIMNANLTINKDGLILCSTAI